MTRYLISNEMFIYKLIYYLNCIEIIVKPSLCLKTYLNILEY